MDLSAVKQQAARVASMLGPSTPMGVHQRTLVLTWLFNDFIAHAFKFAARWQAKLAKSGRTPEEIEALLSDLAREHQTAADKAQAELGALGKPS